MRFSEIKAHLGKFRIGIAGAGGLGSNCAVALARSGIGTLVISDFDTVEPANLNRQYFFTNQVGMMKTVALKESLLRINPDTVVIAHTEKLSSDNIPVIFAACDVVVEAFDSDKMKEMIVETIQIKMPGIPLIIGSGVAGWGKNETIRCRKIDDTLYVCGDESTTADAELPPMAPRVGIVANMQANMVIEILMKKTRDYFHV
ncbi:MAG: sulfur carrier protein ThiS adenylyltransferase ThiF [Bacteroidales bacterium]|jgi:sulfur carrier protein ThiS adenylyltransferase|nr:sulfur carrier protein ThiS adenylyltransferase ThiF [Bacteroidales bacterium]